MEDTLRYFFSAVFQGFAAIITLGAMYFLYFFERIELSKKNIIDKLTPYENETGYKDYIIQNGVIEYLKNILLPKKVDNPAYEMPRKLLKKYEALTATELKIKSYLPQLLRGTISILILSLISLFLIGYNNILNYCLAVVGIVVIILSIKYLFMIKKVILEIIK